MIVTFENAKSCRKMKKGRRCVPMNDSHDWRCKSTNDFIKKPRCNVKKWLLISHEFSQKNLTDVEKLQRVSHLKRFLMVSSSRRFQQQFCPSTLCLNRHNRFMKILSEFGISCRHSKRSSCKKDTLVKSQR